VMEELNREQRLDGFVPVWIGGSLRPVEKPVLGPAIAAEAYFFSPWLRIYLTRHRHQMSAAE
jgi:hypothetical protein